MTNRLGELASILEATFTQNFKSCTHLRKRVYRNSPTKDWNSTLEFVQSVYEEEKRLNKKSLFFGQFAAPRVLLDRECFLRFARDTPHRLELTFIRKEGSNFHVFIQSFQVVEDLVGVGMASMLLGASFFVNPLLGVASLLGMSLLQKKVLDEVINALNVYHNRLLGFVHSFASYGAPGGAAAAEPDERRRDDDYVFRLEGSWPAAVDVVATDE